MIERIKQIMEREGMNQSQFAEAIGIQRAAMSHLVAGRNNPSLDVVTKILHRFPRVNSDWLLFEKGSIYKENVTIEPNLFANTAIFPDESTEAPDFRREIESKQPENTIKQSVIEQIKVIEKPSKNVTKIMLFYSDDTFEVFRPEKK